MPCCTIGMISAEGGSKSASMVDITLVGSPGDRVHWSCLSGSGAAALFFFSRIRSRFGDGTKGIGLD